MSLVARILEAAGIATVIVGSGLDIVEHCGVPRFLFVDFPLGNPCGKPYDLEMQKDVLARALGLLESAAGPRTTERAPHVWGQDESWRDQYMRVDASNVERLRQEGDARRRSQSARKAQGLARSD